MLIPAMVILGLAVSLALLQMFRRNGLHDRILLLNFVGTIVVLFLAVQGYQRGRPEFLDVSLVYALLNFIGTIAVLQLTRFRRLAQNTDLASAEKNNLKQHDSSTDGHGE